MERIQFGKTDLLVPPVAVGTFQLGGDYFGPMDDGQAIATIHVAIEAGFNFIDTAPNYGDAEVRVGKAISDRRDKVILATKCGNFKYPGTRGLMAEF